MGNIVLLDELTINKIAAGEVVERPASVVKELIENSIDAGANNITVEIENGGIKKIKIIDNGCGISKDDMEFAFERHATSKIRQADDLANIKSMGFRGEALASIAAIANVKLVSRTKEEENGNIIVVEGGKVIENEEIAAGIGTTITVTNLFFNTPVRYKFLKKDFTEAGYIEDVVTRVALSHPKIAIKLLNGNKTIIQTNGNGDIKDVIYSIYGKDVAQNIVNVSYKYEDVKVEGIIGKPQIARNNRSYQQFFVNKRYIKDKTLSSAADQAFKGLLTVGKYGFLVLNIEVDPSKIDVNVHPTKLEIRWQEEQKIFKAVYHTIREGLLKEKLIVEEKSEKKEEEIKEESLLENIEKSDKVEIPKEIIEQNTFEERLKEIEKYRENKFKTQVIKTPSFKNIFKKKEDEEENKKEYEEENFIENSGENTIQDLYNRKNGLDFNIGIENIDYEFEKSEEKSEELDFDIDEVDIDKIKIENENIEDKKEDFKLPTEEQLDKVNDILKLQKAIDNIDNKEIKNDFNSMYEKTFGKNPAEKTKKDEEIVAKANLTRVKNISVFEDNENYSLVPAYKFVGSLFNTYIIIEIKDDAYIIDQHAAHERVMYEKVKKNFYSDTQKDSQIMLLPDIINLSHKEKSIVKENVDMFRKAGFILEEFGENTIRLIGVPSLCMDLDTKELFLQLLDEIDTVAITATQEKEEKFLSTIACKAAVKAKMKLSKEEVDDLMKQLLVLKNPFTCPHGRPTAIKITKQEFEKKFERT